ncbi:MAG: SDR family oxidoreductase [Burkholderiaceae bacterium]|nr:SDR family oxidoreductase [Sulfuritalea sp.]MCF8174871.1 SDR family oxidoreductase [Burkholderiaceae bacterium]
MPSPVGRHALVTGGGRGIGAAVAKALVSAGYRVTITGRDRVALDVMLDQLAAPDRCRAVTMDVRDPGSVEQGMGQARSAFGPVAILVNNAGQAESAPFHRTDAAMFQRMLEVNLGGVFHCTQSVLPDMLASGWGRIVNVASTAGLVGYAYVAAYCAAKHGVIGLTRALALEYATKGITVNAVCPGYTETDIVKSAVANIVAKTGRSEDEARAELASGNPMRRLVNPQEVADAVLWICGEGAASINGQSIAVAGGEVM